MAAQDGLHTARVAPVLPCTPARAPCGRESAGVHRIHGRRPGVRSVWGARGGRGGPSWGKHVEARTGSSGAIPVGDATLVPLARALRGQRPGAPGSVADFVTLRVASHAFLDGRALRRYDVRILLISSFLKSLFVAKVTQAKQLRVTGLQFPFSLDRTVPHCSSDSKTDYKSQSCMRNEW